MKHPKVLMIIAWIGVFVGIGCSQVPITGRNQLNFIPASTMLSMSFQQYDEFLKTNRLSDDQDQVRTVKRVGKRIQAAVEAYFRERGLAHELDSYAWEFNLVESDQVNAWAMPGGKVVVYTGLLSVAKNETGLAVVMGHEIAHAIAEHGSERMSQGMALEFGGMALSAALATQPQQTHALWMGVFGAGAQYGILMPYSRLQESEADHLGLIFMAMAGYDPAASLDFWERMAREKGPGASPPEFLSTHPSDETRIENLKKLIPEAMSYYKPPK